MFDIRIFVRMGLFLSIGAAQDARHSFPISGTESEFEFDHEKQFQMMQTNVLSTSITTNFFVGGFQLAPEENGFLSESCDQIVDQFKLDIECSCNLSVRDTSFVQYGCENKRAFCSQWNICALPIYTGTVTQEQPIHSSDICLKSLHHLPSQTYFGDLCVAIDYYDRRGMTEDVDRDTIKVCKAHIGKSKCSCSICGDGNGIQVDCTTVDERLISGQCDNVSLVYSINGGKNQIGGYFPSFRM